MGQQILEEQATPATPATDKVSIYPKAGGGAYKISDDGVEHQLLTNVGDQTIPTINLTGGQIAFPGTAVPSAGVNTLDDYEEGYHTMVITGATSGSISLQSGFDECAYTKIGRVVHIQGYMDVNAMNSPLGDTRFSLPFPAASLTDGGGTSVGTFGAYNLNFNGAYMIAYISAGTSYFRVAEVSDGAALDYLEDEELTISDFFFQLTYFAAT